MNTGCGISTGKVPLNLICRRCACILGSTPLRPFTSMRSPNDTSHRCASPWLAIIFPLIVSATLSRRQSSTSARPAWSSPKKLAISSSPPAP